MRAQPILVEDMFTGDANLKSLTAGSTVIATGLGLWPGVLVDQHFLTRQRDNRLLSAVLDHPDRVGVGIDESTAVIVRDGGFDVIGKSSVRRHRRAGTRDVDKTRRRASRLGARHSRRGAPRRPASTYTPPLGPPYIPSRAGMLAIRRSS